MTLLEEFNLLQAQLPKDLAIDYLPLEKIVPVIDFTLLNLQADSSQLAIFETKIHQYPFAAACLYPEHLDKILIPSAMKKAAVVNFPQGNQASVDVSKAIEKAIHLHGANEIDYVFPWQAYLEGETAAALAHCKQAFLDCEPYPVTFKVILETGVFQSGDMLYQLALDVLNQGCHFLKTSTGKVPVGATPFSAFILLKAMKDGGFLQHGLKVSGGIKNAEQARHYMNLATIYREKEVDKSWFRIGSSGLQEL